MEHASALAGASVESEGATMDRGEHGIGDEWDGRFDVFMPVYNGERYLADCLDSLLAQDYPSFRVLVVDDGSRDSSRSILAEYARRDSRICFEAFPENRGGPVAANRAVAGASAEWIVRMDQDDIMFPDCLRTQAAAIRENPGAAVVSGQRLYIAADGRVLAMRSVPGIDPAGIEDMLQRGVVLGIQHPGTAIRRNAFLEVGGYHPEFWPAVDCDLWHRLAERGHAIFTHGKVVVKYRIHGDSAMASGLELGLERARWSLACMKARRLGHPEPSWESFTAMRKRRPWFSRLWESKDIKAVVLYRRAGLRWGQSLRLRAIWPLALAFLLRPIYVLRRLQTQLSRG